MYLASEKGKNSETGMSTQDEIDLEWKGNTPQEVQTNVFVLGQDQPQVRHLDTSCLLFYVAGGRQPFPSLAARLWCLSTYALPPTPFSFLTPSMLCLSLQWKLTSFARSCTRPQVSDLGFDTSTTDAIYTIDWDATTVRMSVNGQLIRTIQLWRPLRPMQLTMSVWTTMGGCSTNRRLCRLIKM